MSGGIIAAGHPRTAGAADTILRAGGNAFDAIVAAAFASTVAEPVLSSLGGGGFMLARQPGQAPQLYDFFVHTPRRSPAAEELDFYPIHADFGSTTQEFHIGLGSVATPGMVRGLFEINRELGRLPIAEVMQPAIEDCRNGVPIDAFQQYLFEVVAPIYSCSEGARNIFCRSADHSQLVKDGDVLVMPELGATLEALACEGDRLFYEGELARRIDRLCAAEGGTLGYQDLAEYRVVRRTPVTFSYRGVEVSSNPPPSCGGTLIAFALAMLEADNDPSSPGTAADLLRLAEIMGLSNRARAEHYASGIDCQSGDGPGLLDTTLLRHYREQVLGNPAALRGTTHISIIDDAGNAASMSLSNGEGCGHVIPGSGIMLNNMLGEEDLNPGGFNNWLADRRMTSMMSPCLLACSDGRQLALGSGGSNRIRTAILQVVRNIVDHGMSLQQAVTYPRIHYERGLLNIEHGFADEVVEQLQGQFQATHTWQSRNLFFGGVHAVSYHPQHGFDGAGDPRRAGVSVRVSP
jgi:gamma-glutamyltranspeptidase/glutathione hydrolase